MKFIIVLVMVLVAVWLWRSSRRRDDSTQAKAPPPPPASKVGAPQDMVQCPVCSVHLPRTDALPGPDGRLYCCADHRLRGE